MAQSRLSDRSLQLRSNLKWKSRPKHPMPREIAKANIEHFNKLLETEADANKRAVIERLLAEEEQKLAALKKRSERKGS
jgi:hypothetical protein